MNKLFYIFLFAVFPLSILAENIANSSSSEKTAYEYYKNNDYSMALFEYNKLSRSCMTEESCQKIHYNMGVLYSLNGLYSIALKEFNSVLIGPDKNIQEKALYNLFLINGKYLGNNLDASKYYREYLRIKELNK
ncbi:MAG: hypothetical protein PHP69_00870 [Candidatus Omnitrophica bacterium]|jgi:tetratricopeptide (TPR) repeat protein|nr:hypothetical protein [Candidatus Omnitrophota bacterium]MDD5080960.1 hypothetical protein [Candidatus Omnitrophota bacterium]MDD5440603.1 hypothetical protein [Candidatus Omnitrophota bacterium]